jgi:uncharacterized membrane protein (UPF0182 family)
MNPPAATSAPPAPASSQVAAAHNPPELQAAATHYSRAIAALRQGDWTAFGAEMRQLGDELGQPADSGHH